MIELFTIFTKGGIVLWASSFAQVTGRPINALIKAVLLEERSGTQSFISENYALKWSYDNTYDIIFAVVYQKILQLLYIDDLLETVKAAFISKYDKTIMGFGHNYDFDAQFMTLLERVETDYQMKKKSHAKKEPTPFHETKKGRQIRSNPTSNDKETQKAVKDKGNQNNEQEKAEKSSTSNAEKTPQEKSEQDGGINEDPFARTKRILAAKFRKKKVKPATKSPTASKKKGKQKRVWEGGPISAEEEKELNFCNDEPESQSTPDHNAYNKNQKIDLNDYSSMTAPEESSSESEEESPSQQEKEVTPSQPKKEGTKKSTGLLGRLFSGFTYNKEINEENIAPILENFRQHLISKNVASEISDKLCQSVKATLLGKKLGTFTRMTSTVRAAMEESLTRILTPKRNVDILREVQVTKKKGRPYTIVFVGVNGVGKSTSLAKVCSWLLQNDLKVFIAACDTFRSGAVEQLQVHAKILEVPLFHQGYGKDASIIAHQGIEKAKKEGYDVVLIDTAGRMQDNEPLMRSLSKLVVNNQPDLILFVGEALVGNDSVDQLQKYNRALEDFCPQTKTPRLIDGIVLTKFDTVDDKVGAAISMVYTTGQPIVFVGVGQNYSDLKTLNVEHIVSILLAGKS